MQYTKKQKQIQYSKLYHITDLIILWEKLTNKNIKYLKTRGNL